MDIILIIDCGLTVTKAVVFDLAGRQLAAARRNVPQIIAIAATAHGDGVYLLDRQGQPLGNGIRSLDSRAHALVDGWKTEDLPARCLKLTGQAPHASAPSALLAWIRKPEPERFDRIGHVLACKDWLRYCLAGTIGTDRTEASTSFTDVLSQAWSDEALALFGLSALLAALPDASIPRW